MSGYKIHEKKLQEHLERGPVRLPRIPAERQFTEETMAHWRKIPMMAIEERIRRCTRCSIAKDRPEKPVPGAGDRESQHIFIGRMPGKADARENSQLIPGSPVGQQFEKYLVVLGLDRHDIYLTSAVHCPTKDEREPTDGEAATCAIWKAVEFLHLPNAKYLYLMGNDATRAVLGRETPSITRTYGTTYYYPSQGLWPGREIWVFPILHPGSILRDRALSPTINKHLEHIKQRYLCPQVPGQREPQQVTREQTRG